jgi:hypothetical protein
MSSQNRDQNGNNGGATVNNYAEEMGKAAKEMAEKLERAEKRRYEHSERERIIREAKEILKILDREGW